VQPDPKTPSFNDQPQASRVPPLLPATQPPATGAPPALVAASPPALPPKSTRPCSPGRQLLAILLSLFLGLFLVDAVVSLVDDSLILFFGIDLLTPIRGMVFLFATLVAVVVYGLMGLTPMIPKRTFLPLTLFNLAAPLAVVPCLIYFYARIQQVAWVVSVCQVVFGLSILYWVQGGFRLRWPLVAETQLETRRFSWLNLSGFLLVNFFVLLPAVAVYLAFCAALAVGHFSGGFLALRPGSLTVQVRHYVRNDGKTIQLIPMAHVGETAFYRGLSQSFPTNATILLEGVSDRRHLLTNRISYKRMAAALGLAEQAKEFQPGRGALVHADMDVEQFTTNTIDCLNLVMLIHSKGLNPETTLKLLQYSPPPRVQEEFLQDLLRKRNQHLVQEIHAWLPQSQILIVPWGAAHMPEIAREIQKSGFRLDATREFVAIRFRSAGNKSQGPNNQDRESP